MSLDNNCSGQLLVELRIKAMQPELIPDPLEIGNVLCKMLALSDGSGISKRDLISLNTSWYGLTGSLIPDPI